VLGLKGGTADPGTPADRQRPVPGITRVGAGAAGGDGAGEACSEARAGGRAVSAREGNQTMLYRDFWRIPSDRTSRTVTRTVASGKKPGSSDNCLCNADCCRSRRGRAFARWRVTAAVLRATAGTGRGPMRRGVLLEVRRCRATDHSLIGRSVRRSRRITRPRSRRRGWTRICVNGTTSRRADGICATALGPSCDERSLH